MRLVTRTRWRGEGGGPPAGGCEAPTPSPPAAEITSVPSPCRLLSIEGRHPARATLPHRHRLRRRGDGISRHCASNGVNRYLRYGELGVHDREQRCDGVGAHEQPPTGPPGGATAAVTSARRPTQRSLGTGIARRLGRMFHVDVKRTGTIPDSGGWRASAVDGCSRLVCTEALAEEKACTQSDLFPAQGYFAYARHLHRAHHDRQRGLLPCYGPLRRYAESATGALALHQALTVSRALPPHSGRKVLPASTWISGNQPTVALAVSNPLQLLPPADTWPLDTDFQQAGPGPEPPTPRPVTPGQAEAGVGGSVYAVDSVPKAGPRTPQARSSR